MNLMSMFLKRKDISIKRMAQKYIKDYIVMYENRIHTIIDTIGLNNYEVSYGYDFQMCLIDEDGNGFTLTDQYDLSNNSFKLKSLKNIECSCS